MKTVERIIQSCREFNRPIGPQHFLFDRQMREWAAANPEAARILQATREAKVVETRSKSKKSKAKKQEIAVPKLSVEQLQEQKQKLLAKLKTANTATIDQAILRAKYEAQEKKKLADAVQSQCRLNHIKSVGNGL
jgi:hypothetical protein